jgi:hypothetical protein
VFLCGREWGSDGNDLTQPSQHPLRLLPTTPNRDVPPIEVRYNLPGF